MTPTADGEATTAVSWRELAWVGLLFLLLTLLMAVPLSLAPATSALALSADTRLFLWTISWDVHALLHGPTSLFDANIFYPEPRTLAYSEHLLGSAVLGAPALLATGNPVLALNLIVLLSCVLSGLGAYFLARQLGVSVLPALAAGVVFAFGGPRFVRLAQVHLATVQYVPFALAFCHRYVQGRRRRDLLAAIAFFTLQALTSGHGGLFLLLALGALALYCAAIHALPPVLRALRDAGPAGALLLGTNALLLVPYLRAQHDVGLHRTLGAVYDWAPNAASFLAAPSHVQAFLLALVPALRESVDHASAYLFPGWIALLLSALAFTRRAPAAGRPQSPAPADGETADDGWATSEKLPGGLKALDASIVAMAAITLAIHVAGGIDWTIGRLQLTARTAWRALVLLAVLGLLRLALGRSRRFWLGPWLARAGVGLRRFVAARMGVAGGFYVVLLVLSVWASLGPGFWLYTALYRLLPGFDLIRVPSRLGVLTLLAVAVLAAVGLERLLSPLAGRARFAAGVAVVGLLLAEYAAFPLAARPYEIEAPAVDRELAARPRPFAAVELPVADPANAVASARLNSRYMLHSMLHWQPIVNGYSGIVPPRHERLFRILTAFPDTASLAELEAIGVRYAVLHREFYSDAEWASVVARADGLAGRLRLEAETADGRLYSLPLAQPMR
ncbi:MAG: hypothetical protein ACM3PV_12265 [Betaproteobacteria bacterium]